MLRWMCHVSLLAADSHLGLLGWEIETGAAVNSAGQSSKQFFDMGNDPDKDAVEESEEWRRRLLAWMDDGKAGSAPLFEPWRAFQHPQLGHVEIGGFHNTGELRPSILAPFFATDTTDEWSDQLAYRSCCQPGHLQCRISLAAQVVP